jgi:hypothetical protein
LRYKTKGTFGEISLKLRQTNLNVARKNVNVVDDELSREVTSGAKSHQFRSEWTPLGVHVCLDE